MVRVLDFCFLCYGRNKCCVYALPLISIPNPLLILLNKNHITLWILITTYSYLFGRTQNISKIRKCYKMYAMFLLDLFNIMSHFWKLIWKLNTYNFAIFIQFYTKAQTSISKASHFPWGRRGLLQFYYLIFRLSFLECYNCLKVHLGNMKNSLKRFHSQACFFQIINTEISLLGARIFEKSYHWILSTLSLKITYKLYFHLSLISLRFHRQALSFYGSFTQNVFCLQLYFSGIIATL